jgi:hypothetical protein
VSRNSNLENVFWEKDETPWRVAPLHFKLNSKFWLEVRMSEIFTSRYCNEMNGDIVLSSFAIPDV